MKTAELSKPRKITAWIISGLLMALYLFSASGKLIFFTNQMSQFHLENWRIIIAIGELTSSLLFLFPRTNFYGTLLLSSYMGGAILLHMTIGTSIAMPAITLLFVWFTAYLRNPDIFKM